MRLVARTPWLALILAAVTAPLAAQDIHPLHSNVVRHGAWLGLGGGAAQADLVCDGCTVDPAIFPMVDLHLGLAVTRRIALGLEVSGIKTSGGFIESDAIDETLGDANISLYLYPSASGGLWLQGGIGAVQWKSIDDSTATESISHRALTAGAGFDIRLRGNVTLTPSVRGVWGSPAMPHDEEGNDVGTERVKVTYFLAGLSVVWH